MNRSTRATVLINGASRGIGAVYANRLVRRGYERLANSLLSEIERRITPVTAHLAESGSVPYRRIAGAQHNESLLVARLEGQ